MITVILDHLEILGTIIGLIYLYQEYTAKKSLWITGIIMPAIYIYVYYDHGLYADFGLQVYYLFAAVYGWLVWTFGRKHNQKQGEEMPITHFKSRLILPSLLIAILLFAVIAYVLVNFTDSTVPYWDSAVNSLSIIALWMLARKYIEQWLLWLIVDTLCCALYFYKGIPFTAVLYGIYTVIAIFGYYQWRRIMASPYNHSQAS